jgi:hypothetical protein
MSPPTAAPILAGLFLLLATLPGRSAETTCVHCAEYEALSAQAKADLLWSKVVDTTYAELPTDWLDLGEVVEMSEAADTAYAFDRFSDERPVGLERFFHQYGSTARVQWTPASGTTTTGPPVALSGMFADGAQHGILRFSYCAPLLSIALRPPYAFSLKLLRDNMHSANLVTCERPSRVYPAGWNIFNRTVATYSVVNNVEAPALAKAQNGTGVTSSREPALFYENGTQSPQLFAPVMVLFDPSLQLASRPDVPVDFRRDLDTLPVGTTLYTAYTTVDAAGRPNLCTCHEHPEGLLPCWTLAEATAKGCHVVELGSISTTSAFVASEYGDTGIMYQHGRVCARERHVCSQATDPAISFAHDVQQECVSGEPYAGCTAGSTEGGTCDPVQDARPEDSNHCPFAHTLHPSIIDSTLLYPDVDGEEAGDGVCEVEGVSYGTANLTLDAACCVASQAFHASGNFSEALCTRQCLFAAQEVGPAGSLEVCAPRGMTCPPLTTVLIHLLPAEGGCSELCVFPNLLQFVTGHVNGTCASAGFDVLAYMSLMSFPGASRNSVQANYQHSGVPPPPPEYDGVCVVGGVSYGDASSPVGAGCCAAALVFQASGQTYAQPDLCTLDCLAVGLEGSLPACAPTGITCPPDGTVRIQLSLGPDSCTELCVPPATLGFIPGYSNASCSEAGFDVLAGVGETAFPGPQGTAIMVMVATYGQSGVPPPPPEYDGVCVVGGVSYGDASSPVGAGCCEAALVFQASGQAYAPPDLCTLDCLAVGLEGSLPACAPTGITCPPDGTVRIQLSLGPDSCTELCVPPATLGFIPGYSNASCSEAGFDVLAGVGETAFPGPQGAAIMVMVATYGQSAFACAANEVLAFRMQSGAVGKRCNELCLCQVALDLLPRVKAGSCGAVGYTVFEGMVQLSLSPRTEAASAEYARPVDPGDGCGKGGVVLAPTPVPGGASPDPGQTPTSGHGGAAPDPGQAPTPNAVSPTAAPGPTPDGEGFQSLPDLPGHP